MKGKARGPKNPKRTKVFEDSGTMSRKINREKQKIILDIKQTISKQKGKLDKSQAKNIIQKLKEFYDVPQLSKKEKKSIKLLIQKINTQI